MQIPLPDGVRIQLSNGMTVIILPLQHLPLVTFRMLFPYGAAHDDGRCHGCAHLNGELLNKGSQHYSARSFISTVEQIGGILESSTNMDYSVVVGEFLSDHVATGMALLSELVRNPVFPHEEIEKEKRKLIGEIIGKQDSPSYLADLHFRNFLYQNHPYGYPVEGTQDTLKSITGENIIQAYSNQYRPDGAILVIAGNVDIRETEQLVRTHFEDWISHSASAKIIEQPAAVMDPGIRLVDKPEMSQAQIRLGNIGLSRKNSDFFPVVVMNCILGGGFTSRLINQIRVKRGLSYSAWSRFSMRMQGGECVIGTFTKNESVGEVINLIKEELRKMQNEEVAVEEIERVKEYLTGLFPLSIEASESIARIISEIEFYNLEPDYISRYCSRIQAVTINQIHECAKKYLPVKNPVIVAVGTASEIQKILESFGPVEVYPYNKQLSVISENQSSVKSQSVEESEDS